MQNETECLHDWEVVCLEADYDLTCKCRKCGVVTKFAYGGMQMHNSVYKPKKRYNNEGGVIECKK